MDFYVLACGTFNVTALFFYVIMECLSVTWEILNEI